MSQPELNLVEDQETKQNWGNLFNLLSRSEEEKTNNKGAIDQILLQLVFNWLEKRDQCGVVQDLLDIAIYNLAGNTLDGLAGEDLEDFLPPGYNLTDTLPADGGGQSLVANARNAGPISQRHNDGGRNLAFFTDETCSTFESTIFLGSMISFSSCADVDIGKFFGTVEENLVNVGLNCLNTFLSPFQRSSTCASRNFQNYVMDECIKGIVRDDILGHIFQLFLVTPKKTCGCMSTLAAVPQCRVDVSSAVSLDGMLTSKMACLLESQICSKLEGECERRLQVLDECLPSLFDINNENFDCEEVMCNCEKNDKGLMNYPGKAMELPMSDMCAEEAGNNMNFVGSFIPERYAVLQEKCGAKYLHDTEEPTFTPTSSPAPTQFPTVLEPESDVNSLISGREASASPINSVMSGVLLALAITGVAAIFLVFVLALWRKRYRAGGRKVLTVEEMKAQAEAQIRQLERKIGQMEEQQVRQSDSDRRTDDDRSDM